LKLSDEKEELDRSLTNLTFNIGINHRLETLEDVVEALRHHRSRFNDWKVKHPESAADFDLAASNISAIENVLTKMMVGDHSKLLDEVKSLRKSLDEIQNKLQDEIRKRELLENKFYIMEEEAEKQKSIMRAFDLIRMYRFYFLTETAVGMKWNLFCEAYYEWEDDVKEKQIRSQSEFDAFLKPLDDKLPSGLSIKQMMEITENRHDIAHHNINSASNQKAFLEECANAKFVGDANFVASKILPELQTVKLTRMK
jgi:hypothetical protein